MTKMRMPYQCMQKCGTLLVAARGSNIDLFNLNDGSFISTWQCPPSQGAVKVKPSIAEASPKLENKGSESSSVDITVESSAPPAKRRKLSEDGQDENSAKTHGEENKGGTKKTKKEKKQGNRLDSVASGLDAPAVIALAVTSDSQHMIAITGEDKSIRVFSVTPQDGVANLQHLSQRQVIFNQS
ncbi:tRNA (guanine-N(7)-)-methyltransferase non-catalytic subunit trm82 [Lachnellula suecica]|uniref:tRNA (Guanine-N(7)-)-methyltransferase non-catalytic subunit trm82 n=1 Tax=Lachnellula suecica TaxID=602035 RepID=A0A8T9CME1_9HELO|nr:tRNA (guanine-N(7)-)-methyltransferase non-catalytic subunit trm82 [Lachnellula suecica]